MIVVAQLATAAQRLAGSQERGRIVYVGAGTSGRLGQPAGARAIRANRSPHQRSGDGTGGGLRAPGDGLRSRGAGGKAQQCYGRNDKRSSQVHDLPLILLRESYSLPSL
jgi:hypothetical protein